MSRTIYNTQNNATISAFQLAALLLMTRVFSECMNFPVTSARYEMQQFAAIFTAKIILFFIFIPVLIFAKKHPGENFFTVIAGKSKVFGWIVFVLAAAHFLTDAFGNFIKFEFFTANTLMVTAPSWALITLGAAVALYGMNKGIQAAARLGGVLFIFFILLLLISSMSLFTSSNINLKFLYPALIENPDTFLSQILSELKKNNEVFVFAVLCRYVGKTKLGKPHRTVYFYISALTIILLFMTFLFIVTFGPYINIISFPFYTMNSLASAIIFDRLDGFDAIIWMVSALLNIITAFICIKSMLGTLIKEKPSKITASVLLGVICVLAVMGAADRNKVLAIYGGEEFIASLLIIGIIAPIAALIMGKGKKGETG